MQRRRTTDAGLGLIIGAGLGLVVGVLFTEAEGGLGLALSLVIGAGLGLVAGAALGSRSRHE